MYLLDADTLIDAKNRYYSFEVAPGFWEWLERASAEGKVASVAKVREELNGHDDELSEWAGRQEEFFLAEDVETVAAMRSLSAWAMSGERRYTEAAKHAFLRKGDYYLIGAALAHGHVVVTNEISQPESRKRVKIPDVCAAMDVRCLTLFAMLRNERARFVTP
jgi:hypothetical protein